MQQLRGVKRSHDVAAPSWPGDVKRPAVVADYPPSASRYLHIFLICTFIVTELFIFNL